MTSKKLPVEDGCSAIIVLRRALEPHDDHDVSWRERESRNSGGEGVEHLGPNAGGSELAEVKCHAFASFTPSSVCGVGSKIRIHTRQLTFSHCRLASLENTPWILQQDTCRSRDMTVVKRSINRESLEAVKVHNSRGEECSFASVLAGKRTLVLILRHCM